MRLRLASAGYCVSDNDRCKLLCLAGTRDRETQETHLQILADKAIRQTASRTELQKARSLARATSAERPWEFDGKGSPPLRGVCGTSTVKARHNPHFRWWRLPVPLSRRSGGIVQIPTDRSQAHRGYGKKAGCSSREKADPAKDSQFTRPFGWGFDLR